jgi:hypothetical protein
MGADRSVPTSEPAHRLCLNEGQGRPAPLFPADVMIRGAPRFAPDVTHLTLLHPLSPTVTRHLPSHAPRQQHTASPQQACTSSSASPHRARCSTPAASPRSTTMADTAGTAKRLPRSGRSKLSSSKASATGATPTSSPHLSPSTP